MLPSIPASPRFAKTSIPLRGWQKASTSRTGREARPCADDHRGDHPPPDDAARPKAAPDDTALRHPRAAAAGRARVRERQAMFRQEALAAIVGAGATALHLGGIQVGGVGEVVPAHAKEDELCPSRAEMQSRMGRRRAAEGRGVASPRPPLRRCWRIAVSGWAGRRVRRVHDKSCPYLGPPCGGPALSSAQRAISFRPSTVIPWLDRTEAASSCASVRTTRP